jgi:putative ABC transport system permease protein
LTREPRVPSALARLASALLRRDDREFLLGDLEDAYAARAASGSRVTASFVFLIETVHAAVARRQPAHTIPDPSPGGHLMLDTLLRDIRFGIRGLLKRPGFTVAALVTLALGIGANAAVFSVVNGVLLAPLPYTDAENVLVLWSKWRNFDKTWVSPAEILDYRNRTRSFESVGGWSVAQANLTGEGEAMRVGAAFVTPNLFDVLGNAPVAGRVFTEEEATQATATVVILGHELWQQRFGGRAIVGSTIEVDGVAREVIGIMPAGFQLPTDYVQDAEEPTRLWLPLRLDPTQRGSHGLHAAARLNPGVSAESANAELRALTETLTKEGLYPEPMQFTAFGVSATDEAYGDVRNPILLLAGAVGCLMLIACANVANLLLVRAESRAREMAVRAALGATRRRLVTQMLTESGVLAVVSAGAGLALAWGALRLILAVDLTAIPRSANIALDMPVLIFSVGLTLLTLLLFSLPPAWRAARVDVNDTIKEGALTTTAGGRRHRARGLLVATEAALAVALLAGALLMVRSVWNLQQIDLGLDPDDTLTMALAVPRAKYDRPEKVIAFYDRLLDQVRQMPGVRQAGFVRVLPLASSIGDWGMQVEGYQPPPGTGTPGDWQVVTEGALAALGERVLRGREFRPSDVTGSQQVGLINEAMAHKYFAGRDPLGARFKQGGGNDNTNPWITVVGIVGNVRHNGITGIVKPKFYRPHSQFHESRAFTPANMTLVVRTDGDPLALARPIRAEVQRMDPDVPVAAVRTMEKVVAASIATPRLTGWLLGVFAALAVLLAGIGIYSVLSYVVSQRRREIGIRVAMGATRRQVVGLIWTNGFLLTGAGVAAGMVIAALTTRAMTSLLHGVTPLDPVTFVAAPVLLMAVASLAALIPALRATRVDAVRALRAD